MRHIILLTLYHHHPHLSLFCSNDDTFQLHTIIDPKKKGNKKRDKEEGMQQQHFSRVLIDFLGF